MTILKDAKTTALSKMLLTHEHLQQFVNKVVSFCINKLVNYDNITIYNSIIKF